MWLPSGYTLRCMALKDGGYFMIGKSLCTVGCLPGVVARMAWGEGVAFHGKRRYLIKNMSSRDSLSCMENDVSNHKCMKCWRPGEWANIVSMAGPACSSSRAGGWIARA